MFFSILIPVYNTIQYIEECIDSILEQNFDDYEVILIDDGSTDECALYCDALANRFSHFSVIHKKNEGLLITRRKGFLMATGKFFVCIDSDDYLQDNNAFQKIYEKIKETDCDLLLFDYIYGGPTKSLDRIISIIENDQSLITDKVAFYEAILQTKWSNPIWAKVIARHLLDIDFDYSDISKDLFKSLGEDFVQSLPICTNAKKVYHLSEPLYYYRLNMGSLSRKADIRFYDAFKTSYEIISEYLEKWEINQELKEQYLLNRQKAMVSHLIASIPQKRKDRERWVSFVKEIKNDQPLVDFVNSNVKGRVNGYYQTVAKLIVKDRPYRALAVVDGVQMSHRVLERMRGKSNAT